MLFKTFQKTPVDVHAWENIQVLEEIKEKYSLAESAMEDCNNHFRKLRDLEELDSYKVRVHEVRKYLYTYPCSSLIKIEIGTAQQKHADKKGYFESNYYFKELYRSLELGIKHKEGNIEYILEDLEDKDEKGKYWANITLETAKEVKARLEEDLEKAKELDNMLINDDGLSELKIVRNKLDESLIELKSIENVLLELVKIHNVTEV